MERRKKRRKVITRYPSIVIPSFPVPQPEEIRNNFAKTEEARRAILDPKVAFVHLTKMIVSAQMKSISEVYCCDGPFSFIAKTCLETLNLFQEKMVIRSEDKAVAKFERFSEKLPRELELENAFKCVNDQHAKVAAQISNLNDLKEKIEKGTLVVAVNMRTDRLPELGMEEALFAEEELVQNETLQRHHDKLSDIVLDNLSTKLTKRWLKFQEESKDRQEQLKMRKVYDTEIESAGLQSVGSILESFRVISLI